MREKPEDLGGGSVIRAGDCAVLLSIQLALKTSKVARCALE